MSFEDHAQVLQFTASLVLNCSQLLTMNLCGGRNMNNLFLTRNILAFISNMFSYCPSIKERLSSATLPVYKPLRFAGGLFNFLSLFWNFKAIVFLD